METLVPIVQFQGFKCTVQGLVLQLAECEKGCKFHQLLGLIHKSGIPCHASENQSTVDRQLGGNMSSTLSKVVPQQPLETILKFWVTTDKTNSLGIIWKNYPCSMRGC